MDTMLDIPGGPGFQDVTDLFEAATEEMDEGELLFTDGFELQDAMTAFEIGEPRMDTGVILDGDEKVNFNPTSPLLPEEVCWIIDRSFACEAEWHVGTTLSQSVFTLLYVHHLEDLNPEFMLYENEREDNLERPVELLSIVIRAAVFGLLKSCDMAWRELNKGRVLDGEDWQAEKCEVSLLEGVQLWTVFKLLDDALRWILSSAEVPDDWRRPLHARVLLRKTILELITTNPRSEGARFDHLLTGADELLHAIRTNPVNEPTVNSAAHHALDPHVTRKLHSFMPLRPIELRSQERTWDALQGWLYSWSELRSLASSQSVATWEIVGLFQAWSPAPSGSIPFMRSLTQSTFYNEVLVLDQFSPTWLADRFFKEILAVPYHLVSRAIQQRWTGSEEPALRELERALIKLLARHIRLLWANAPRRRRHLAKSVFAWHELHEALLFLVSDLHDDVDLSAYGVLPRAVVEVIPDVAFHERLLVTREVVLSGFQLDLYSNDEKTAAYWYAAEVLAADKECLERLLSVVSHDAATYGELVFQWEFSAGLANMCAGMFAVQVAISTQPPAWELMRANFERRHKWASDLGPGSEAVRTPATVLPVFEEFVTAYEQLFDSSRSIEGMTALSVGRSRLARLAESAREGRAGRWSSERYGFVRRVAETAFLPSLSDEGGVGNVGKMAWDPQLNPWFPVATE